MAAEAPDTFGEIVIVYADDGNEWALFIQRKLTSPEYNIRTHGQDYSTVNIPSLKNYKVQVVLISPQLLEGAASSQWDFAQFDKSSTVMVLLGLDVLEVKNILQAKSEYIFQCNHETIHQNDPGTSLRNALMEIIKVYEQDEFSDEEDPFDTDSIYQYPPSPRQINQIYKIIPKAPNSSSPETLILLDRPSDTDLTVELRTSPPVKVTAQFIDKAVYAVDIPEGTRGTIPVKVSCRDQVLGEDRVKLQTKMDQLYSLLHDITNPMTLMCQALGLNGDNNEALDSAMSQQLKKWSPQNIQMLQMFEASVTDERSSHKWPTIAHFAAEFNLVNMCTELLRFPHTFMVMACCMENCDGDYPCDIAERKGFQHLAQLLTSVVEEHNVDSGIMEPELPPPAPHMKAFHYINQTPVEGVLDLESPYMDMTGLQKGKQEVKRSVSEGGKRLSFMNLESSSNGEDQKSDAPKPRILRPASEGSAEEVSSSPEALTDFLSSFKPPPSLPHKKGPTPTAKPQVAAKPQPSRSASPSLSSSSSMSSSTSSRPSSYVKPPLPKGLKPGSSSSPKASDVESSPSESPQASPRESFVKGEKSLESTPDAFGEDSQLVSQLYGDILASSAKSGSGTQGVTHDPRDFVFSDDEASDIRLEGYEHPSALIGDIHTTTEPAMRGRTTRSKISSFLKRIGMKKQSSLQDPHRTDKQNKKTRFYVRQARGSDPGLSGIGFDKLQLGAPKSYTVPRKMSLPAVLEPTEARDSGSYSEEEDGSTDAEKISYRRKSGKQPLSQKSRQSLERRKSVRLSRAMNENISDAPSMPQQQKAGRFRNILSSAPS
ncbi:phosphoinositide 3-kinase adapter protein 1-like isoform X2 [Haliotis rufescens]|uniref:phosphoinositide 3-kinase adapter protein 1-like isoform X2 n=1 Tax=Haliotis rufescens TaxID=6454 RepID=UPI00201E9078|nr:phosphoinositide 3-kinase adapter protein 1-like isoform X2 [Haliotis rufescens]